MRKLLGLNGNLWYFHGQNYWIVIPTNGTVKRDGSCVMGRGLAKDLKRRDPNFPYVLGSMLQDHGNHVFAFPTPKIFTFPVKHHWKEKADLDLIQSSAVELLCLVDKHNLDGPFYLPRVGCGNGKRDWDTDVKPILKNILDNRFVVVRYKEA
jgi:hypothetical protein